MVRLHPITCLVAADGPENYYRLGQSGLSNVNELSEQNDGNENQARLSEECCSTTFLGNPQQCTCRMCISTPCVIAAASLLASAPASAAPAATATATATAAPFRTGAPFSGFFQSVAGAVRRWVIRTVPAELPVAAPALTPVAPNTILVPPPVPTALPPHPPPPVCTKHNLTLRNVQGFMNSGLLKPLQEQAFMVYCQFESSGRAQIGLFAALDVDDCLGSDCHLLIDHAQEDLPDPEPEPEPRFKSPKHTVPAAPVVSPPSKVGTKRSGAVVKQHEQITTGHDRTLENRTASAQAQTQQSVGSAGLGRGEASIPAADGAYDSDSSDASPAAPAAPAPVHSPYVDPIMLMYRENGQVNALIQGIIDRQEPVELVLPQMPGQNQSQSEGERAVEGAGSPAAPTPATQPAAQPATRHLLWSVKDPEEMDALRRAFADEVHALYIADGHHRVAAACKARLDLLQARQAGARAGAVSDRAHNPALANSSRYLTALIYADTQLTVLPYNRCVASLQPLSSAAAFLDKLSFAFRVELEPELEKLPAAATAAAATAAANSLPSGVHCGNLDVKSEVTAAGDLKASRARGGEGGADGVVSGGVEGAAAGSTTDSSVANDSSSGSTTSAESSSHGPINNSSDNGIGNGGGTTSDNECITDSSCSSDSCAGRVADGVGRSSTCYDITMYLDGRWYRLHPLLTGYARRAAIDPVESDATGMHHRNAEEGAEEDAADEGSEHELDPLESIDSQVLLKYVFNPILGMDDPEEFNKHNHMIYVDGRHGRQGIERLVDSGEAAVGFAVGPVSTAQIMSVSDADEVLPAKTTFFDPKPVPGLLLRLQH